MGDDLEPYLLVTSTEVMHLGYAGEDAPQHTVGCTATLLNRLDETYEGDQLFDPLTFDPQHIKNLWQEAFNAKSWETDTALVIGYPDCWKDHEKELQQIGFEFGFTHVALLKTDDYLLYNGGRAAGIVVDFQEDAVVVSTYVEENEDDEEYPTPKLHTQERVSCKRSSLFVKPDGETATKERDFSAFTVVLPENVIPAFTNALKNVEDKFYTSPAGFGYPASANSILVAPPAMGELLCQAVDPYIPKIRREIIGLYSHWCGASIFCGFSPKRLEWVTKEDWFQENV